MTNNTRVVSRSAEDIIEDRNFHVACVQLFCALIGTDPIESREKVMFALSNAHVSVLGMAVGGILAACFRDDFSAMKKDQEALVESVAKGINQVLNIDKDTLLGDADLIRNAALEYVQMNRQLRSVMEEVVAEEGAEATIQ